VLVFVFLCLGPSLAHAQVEISGGLGWSGGYDIGNARAALRTNAPGATPPPFTLFNVVDSRMAPAPGGEIRVGVAIGSRLTIEGGALLAKQHLAFGINGDREARAQQFDGEAVHHYVFDGGVLWELPVVLPARLRAFASGGAGYLRQLHQDRTLVESGQVYYAGGGAKFWLRGRPGSKSLGVRGDVRINLRRHGIDFENKNRIYPTVSLFMFVGF
jgi:hypothetical protein